MHSGGVNVDEKFEHNIKSFTVGIFCESNGVPSSSRVLMFALAGIACWILVTVVRHIVAITDLAALALWLSHFPMIVAALVAFVAMPYTINKASGTISDVITALRGNGGKRENQQP
jgi:hypothetical protein